MDSLEDLFPRLRGSKYEVTSPEDIRYNCIAWVVGDPERWWWPDDSSHWPTGSPREETVAAFVATFQQIGFEECEASPPEAGFEKVAIYASADGIPTHAAKQLENGLWSSKLGQLQDIQHHLEDLASLEYGDVVRFLKRRSGGVHREES
jgi:hypothetical protein